MRRDPRDDQVPVGDEAVEEDAVPGLVSLGVLGGDERHAVSCRVGPPSDRSSRPREPGPAPARRAARSGCAPRASLIVEKPSRNPIQAVASKISRSLSPASTQPVHAASVVRVRIIDNRSRPGRERRLSLGEAVVHAADHAGRGRLVADVGELLTPGERAVGVAQRRRGRGDHDRHLARREGRVGKQVGAQLREAARMSGRQAQRWT